jgi:hypothetical protein
MAGLQSKRKPIIHNGIEIEPTFGQRMGAAASDVLTAGLVKGYDLAATDKSKMSAAHKIYLDTFGLKEDRSPITRSYFSPEEQAAISDLISRKGGKRGYLTYEDQKRLRKEAGISEVTKPSDVVAGKIGPYVSVANSLGQFGYEYDPKANAYKILDEYDFNYAVKDSNKNIIDDDFAGDYITDKMLSPRDLARIYAGRKMPPGTGRKIDLSIPAVKISPQATASGWNPELEQQFQQEIAQSPWYKDYTKKYGEAPDLNTKDYNYRAAWQLGARPELYKYDNTYHWPSTAQGRSLKAVNHPTAWMEDYMQITGRDPNQGGNLTPQQANTLSSMLQLRYGGLESTEEPVWKKVKAAVERAFSK